MPSSANHFNNGAIVFYVNDKVAKAADYNLYSVNNQPIRSVQAVGKDVYFTKFLFEGVYAGGCGGGGATILEIYKRASNGEINKVVTDRVSSNSKDAFVVSGKYMYYAKLVNKGMGNFTIVKSTLNGKIKKTLQKGVDDFWVYKKYIYFVKNKKLYRMDMNGKGVKSFNTKTELYGNHGCGEGNYSVSKNGVTITSDRDESNYFFDFSKSSITKLVRYSIDVDLQKKRLVSITDGEDEEDVYVVYDLKGKLIKRLKGFDRRKGPQFYSIDAKSGQLLYIDGSKIKQIKF